MGLETKRWDVTEHLDSDEAVLAYLEAVFEDGDPQLIAAALNDVARARGVTVPEGLSPNSDFSAVVRTVKSLGFELTAKAA
jgi:DNA-binding phage protein